MSSLNTLINIMFWTLFLSRGYAASQPKSRKPKSRKIHDPSRKETLRSPLRHLRQDRQRPRPVRGRVRRARAEPAGHAPQVRRPVQDLGAGRLRQRNEDQPWPRILSRGHPHARGHGVLGDAYDERLAAEHRPSGSRPRRRGGVRPDSRRLPASSHQRTAPQHHAVLGWFVPVGGLAARRIEIDLEAGVARHRRGQPPAEAAIPRAAVREPEAEVRRAGEATAREREAATTTGSTWSRVRSWRSHHSANRRTAARYACRMFRFRMRAVKNSHGR